MNRTEIKDVLKDIIQATNSTIIELKGKQEWLQIAIEKAEQLEDHLSELMGDAFDKDELLSSVTNVLLSNELEEIYDKVENLRDDINAHSEELTGLKQEHFLEKYENLDLVQEKFSQSTSAYETIDEVIDHLEEAIELLKNM